jgi:hypothetical protein
MRQIRDRKQMVLSARLYSKAEDGKKMRTWMVDQTDAMRKRDRLKKYKTVIEAVALAVILIACMIVI